jgi:hypothetical protein
MRLNRRVRRRASPGSSGHPVAQRGSALSQAHWDAEGFADGVTRSVTIKPLADSTRGVR